MDVFMEHFHYVRINNNHYFGVNKQMKGAINFSL